MSPVSDLIALLSTIVMSPSCGPALRLGLVVVAMCVPLAGVVLLATAVGTTATGVGGAAALGGVTGIAALARGRRTRA